MNKKILIVDDDPSVRQLICVTLRAFEVIECFNGFEALGKVISEKPDLILLDIMMPKMNGFEVIRRLKADTTTARIPIVLLTARGDRNTLERSQQEGVITYIMKPFSPRSLARRVKEIMDETGKVS
ncbi:response regulator [Nitrospira defluvii]|nr:response regulator [Nitrospira defluvii]